MFAVTQILTVGAISNESASPIIGEVVKYMAIVPLCTVAVINIRSAWRMYLASYWLSVGTNSHGLKIKGFIFLLFVMLSAIVVAMIELPTIFPSLDWSTLPEHQESFSMWYVYIICMATGILFLWYMFAKKWMDDMVSRFAG
ncbi:MAG: hypothetical protein HYT94_05430 [Parcubacteria group bacterium]|nr:hypothetical protein [Parcubacteria group bacterium]